MTLFQEDSPVSPFSSPGSAEARKMTVTSGLKCLELYKNSDQLGSLVKMCLESSVWHSTRCYLTWKVAGMIHSRLLYRLAASMPRTNATGCSFWPTPKASSPFGGCSGARKTLQRMTDKGLITEEERRQFQQGNGGKTNPALLEWLMGYEQQFTKLIPTPMASDCKGAPLNRYWTSQTVQVERERERERQVSVSADRTSGGNSVWQNWPDEPGICRVVDGVPNRVDRIRCLGNAVVPQVVYPFFEFIKVIEQGGNNDDL